jgi:hypothetical protein
LLFGALRMSYVTYKEGIMLKPVNMTERQKAGQLKFLARVHAKQPPSTLSPQEQEEAQREFYHELETIRSLCLQLLEKGRSSGIAARAAA